MHETKNEKYKYGTEQYGEPTYIALVLSINKASNFSSLGLFLFSAKMSGP